MRPLSGDRDRLSASNGARLSDFDSAAGPSGNGVATPADPSRPT
jgi:hypothetical protein